MKDTDYWPIVERFHLIQNPISEEKLDILIELCGLDEPHRVGARVLDVGCGKAALLTRWAMEWSIDAIGLELNPAFAAEPLAFMDDNELVGDVRIIEGPALDYTPEPASFDIVLCIGASFALGGFEKAVAWMRRAMRPGGVLVIGEPFLNMPPVPEDRTEDGVEALTYPTLDRCAGILAENDLSLVMLIASSTDEWDEYEGLHWLAAHQWLMENPRHRDRAALAARVDRDRRAYLRWERRCLGWGMFVGRS